MKSMEKNRSLICREPQLKKEAASERLRLLEAEEELFSVLDELCCAEAAVAAFVKRECEPKLAPLEKKLENLKRLVLGGKSSSQNQSEVKKKPDADFDGREFKSLYRKLAALYHPDKNRSDNEKKFFLARMKEINESFLRRDLQALRRIFKRALRELEGENSALYVLRNIREEIKITQDLKHLYSKKLKEFKKSEKYSWLSMSREDFSAELVKMELKLKAEIYTYSRFFYGS